MPKKKRVRDYKKEYARDHSSPKAIKDRTERTTARRKAIREGRVDKGTKDSRSTQEIDHKVPLSKGGSYDKSNQRIVSRTTNRKKADKMPSKATAKKAPAKRAPVKRGKK